MTLLFKGEREKMDPKILKSDINKDKPLFAKGHNKNNAHTGAYIYYFLLHENDVKYTQAEEETVKISKEYIGDFKDLTKHTKGGVKTEKGESIELPHEKNYLYLYKNNIYSFPEESPYIEDERQLLIKEHYAKKKQKVEELKKELKFLKHAEPIEEKNKSKIDPISEHIKSYVWKREQGRCAKCGSNKNLEFGHIIPVSKGGSNSEKNVQLLCMECNQEKIDFVTDNESKKPAKKVIEAIKKFMFKKL